MVTRTLLPLRNTISASPGTPTSLGYLTLGSVFGGDLAAGGSLPSLSSFLPLKSCAGKEARKKPTRAKAVSMKRYMGSSETRYRHANSTQQTENGGEKTYPFAHAPRCVRGANAKLGERLIELTAD